MALLLCILLSLPAAAPAEFLVGVGTHFAQHGKETPGEEIPVIAQAGFNAIRDEVYWGQVETLRGKYRLPGYALDYPRRAVHRGLKLLLVLGYGNRWYDGGAKPVSSAAISGYGRYCAFIGETLRDVVWGVEVWNEWHGKTGSVGPGSPEGYLPLASSCRNGVASAATGNLPILYGSTGLPEIGNGYLLRMLTLLATELPDEPMAVSIHPYIHCDRRATPESWYLRLYEGLTTIRRVLDRPIDWYITEMGWPTGTGKCGRSLHTVAAYAVRTILLAKTIPGMKGFFWYQWRDEGADPHRFQDGFGLTDKWGRAKPALTLLREWLPFLKQSTFVEWESRGKAGQWAARFRWRGRDLSVRWQEMACDGRGYRSAACRPSLAVVCDAGSCN